MNPNPFITKWETTATNESITIPTVAGEIYSYTVNWGDGSEDTIHTDATPPTHTYFKASIYTISGTFPRIRFSGKSTVQSQIRTIEKWGDIAWTSMRNAFTNCDNLTIADEAGIPNLSGVTDMFGMFAQSSFNGDINEWDVGNVMDTSYMFSKAGLINVDISGWDVSNVTNMQTMTYLRKFGTLY
ncbi:MAG: BspA family leucine-rich repeat surface protein [Ekhidna sp.]|nr:BspA family leucine-rich repeat surface protein [Ekhidna sp.]